MISAAFGNDDTIWPLYPDGCNHIAGVSPTAYIM